MTTASMNTPVSISVSSRKGLPHLYQERPDRVGGDRLEILTALINGPSFDPIFRAEVIKIPRDHLVYWWGCAVEGCERTRSGGSDLCSAHLNGLKLARKRGVTPAAYVTAATGLARFRRVEDVACRICPDLPATGNRWSLCERHVSSWQMCPQRGVDGAGFERWLTCQEPIEGYGICQVAVCVNMAATPLGLCLAHGRQYGNSGRPGGARIPQRWSRDVIGHLVSPTFDDQTSFHAWCARQIPITWPGQINLRGLRPLLRAEIQWTLFANAAEQRANRWEPGWIQKLANLCQQRDAGSLTDLDLEDIPAFHASIATVMLHHLRLIYFTASQTRDAGFIETDHFGVRFPHRASHIDLTAIPQRWLRDLLWDYLADLFRSPRHPRTRLSIDTARRAITELGAFLEVDAPGGGQDPTALTVESARRFIADQRHRAAHGLPSIVMIRGDSKPSVITKNTLSLTTNAVRKVLRAALESGRAEQLQLDREFIIAMPTAGGAPLRARRPFPDEVARALAAEANLATLAKIYDPEDQGLRDVWETLVMTGRRVNEVLQVRWDCLGRYGGLSMFWHDQTKVGNYDAAIRIPESIYQRLAERQHKTLDRFVARTGRTPSTAERATLALFPSNFRNPDQTISKSYQWFRRAFRSWLDDLSLGPHVAHQARHTLATSLLRHGATLTHIRKYLGHVSDRMAEHYVHLSHSDLENVLQHVWVAGPGTANPGQLLSGKAAGSLTREQAMAIAIDLTRRSTPAEGGFCTFQPVVSGGACPWNLNCHSCDKFVLSGADLLYWRRKSEQWRLLAENAPDDATADYLHTYFQPTALAIDGLENALAGLGLLDEALALDMRKPQDYFHRIWSTAFLAHDLTAGQLEEQHDQPDAGATEYDKNAEPLA